MFLCKLTIGKALSTINILRINKYMNKYKDPNLHKSNVRSREEIRKISVFAENTLCRVILKHIHKSLLIEVPNKYFVYDYIILLLHAPNNAS